MVGLDVAGGDEDGGFMGGGRGTECDCLTAAGEAGTWTFCREAGTKVDIAAMESGFSDVFVAGIVWRVC